VLLDVAGGCTISGLDGFEDDASPESLVTCILKVSTGCVLQVIVDVETWLGSSSSSSSSRQSGGGSSSS
jgi:hypothetical protein